MNGTGLDDGLCRLDEAEKESLGPGKGRGVWIELEKRDGIR